MKKKITIVLNIAGLSPTLLRFEERLPNITALKKNGTYRKMKPSFPALTCSVQSTLLSGKPPADHGIVGNGYFDRISMKPEFWRQESALVNGPRIWDIMRQRDSKSKVAVLFWQNTKYIDADIVITPSPLHTESGIIEWCYSKPSGLYEKISEQLGPFNLKDYWGPFAGRKSSQWITDASLIILENELPDMLLVYIPHLDYVSQRSVPDSTQVQKELSFVDEIVGRFIGFTEKYGKENSVLFVISEYGLVPVNRTVYPNILLREKGLLKVRDIGGCEYIDFEQSNAFAVVDHQIAHIYCKPNVIKQARQIISAMSGVKRLLDRAEQHELQIHNNRSGDLIALTQNDTWFAYYYWVDEKKAPFYARTVDIHNKPGYDPCELFIDPEKKAIPLRPELVKGSHGLPAESEQQFSVMICSSKEIDDYAPEPFNAPHFLGMLYRVI
jgi:predicted AlkP superfamily pyrophosphatase or phosphodiesterase